MADLIQTPAASGIIPPDPQSGLRSLAGILGIQRQRQELQQGAAAIETARAGATVATQNANENQSLAKLLSDPVGNGITDGDGNPTKNAQSIVMRAAPTTGAEQYEKVVNAAKSKIEFNRSVNNLRSEQRAEVANTIGGVAADPTASYQDLKNQLQGLVASKAGTPVADDYQKISEIALKGLDHVNGKEQQTGQIVPSGKEAWRQGSLNMQRGLLGAAGVVGAGGVATPQGAQVDQGGQIQPGTTAPPMQGGGFTPAGQPIVKTTPPTVTTNATGQLVRVAPGGAGASVVPTTAPPGQGGPAPNANPTQAQAVGQRGQAEAVSQRVGQVQAQAANTVQAQDALSRAKAILESGASPDTGTGFEQKRQLKNVMSSLGIDTQGADDMNTLSKNLARYEASRATAAGLGGTDAARELAHNGSPNTQLDNKALQGIVRQSLATEKILAGYANVQSKTNDPQQQLQNEVAFRTIPHPIETAEYLMSRNKAEAEAYLKEHGISHTDIAKSATMLKQFGAL